MNEAANSHCQKLKGTHLYRLPATAATVAQHTISESHLIHLPVAHRALQQSSSLKACPPRLCLRFYLTHLAASLLQNTASTRKPAVFRGRCFVPRRFSWVRTKESTIPLNLFSNSPCVRSSGSRWGCFTQTSAVRHRIDSIYVLHSFLLLVQLSIAALSHRDCIHIGHFPHLMIYI